MPRQKRQEVWKHFFITKNPTENKSTKCRYCEKIYKIAHVNKMENHLIKCIKCPDAVKHQLMNPVTIIQVEEDTLIARNLNMQTKKTKTASLDQNYQSTEITEDKKGHLDESLSKAIFATDLPISMVEHPLWIKFFKELQPQYELPSRKEITTTHLDAIHHELESEIIEDLKSASNLHLQCDGWSNQRAEGVFNIIVATAKPIYVKSLCTLTTQNSSQYLSEEILKVIEKYGAHKIATLIGDCSDNIQKAFNLVRTVHPHVLPLTCVAHALNLFCEDCLKPGAIIKFIKIVISVVKTVKGSKDLSALLAQIIEEKGSGETLILPTKTHWSTYYKALKSLQRTKVALQALAVHEKIIMTSEVKTHILDETFWSKTESCTKLLEPVAEILNKIEDNNFNIHEVYMAFKDIKSKINNIVLDLPLLNDSDKVDILTSLEIRMNDCLRPIHSTAYMLDPRTKGQHLDENHEIEAMKFLDDIGSLLNLNLITDIANYKAKAGFWGKSFVWKSVSDLSPMVWWKGICASTHLSKIAVRLLATPCTSVPTGRKFNTLDLGQNATQNGLSMERAAKISYVSYNWNLLNNIENGVENEDENNMSTSIDNPSSSPMNEPSSSRDTSQNVVFVDLDEVINTEYLSDSDNE